MGVEEVSHERAPPAFSASAFKRAQQVLIERSVEIVRHHEPTLVDAEDRPLFLQGDELCDWSARAGDHDVFASRYLPQETGEVGLCCMDAHLFSWQTRK